MTVSPDGNNNIVIIKAKPSTYNSVAILSLYGTNSSTYGGSVVVRSSILSSTDGTAFGANLIFKTNDTSNVEQERMRITSAGDTQLTGNNLDIKGSNAGNTSVRITDSTGTVGTDSLDLINDGTAAYIWNRANTDLKFATNSTERMHISNAGTLTVGGQTNTRIVTTITENDKVDLNVTDGTNTTRNLTFSTGGTQRMRLTADGELRIGTGSGANGKLHVSNTDLNRKLFIEGNNNSQGYAQKATLVSHYPVVSAGTQLIIPFTSQGNLNSNTIMKIMGHSARYNASDPLGFTATIQVGHLQQLYSAVALDSTGNISGVSTSGMNLIISFTSAYTYAVADGVFVTIEYMTNHLSYSLQPSNIVMN
jgi:hypothetical protein